jgi:phospholipase/carboxylesterase
LNSDNTQTIEIGGWIIRQRIPEGTGSHPVILLLHGWTGDENSMSVFAPRLPEDALLLAPRGPHAAPLGGYSWHPHKAKAWPWVDDMRPAIDSLVEILNLNYFPLGDFTRLSLLGFSQGAALAYTFALLCPLKAPQLGCTAVAGLSGFLPDGFAAHLGSTNYATSSQDTNRSLEKPLQGLPVFMAHGTRDELVPVEKARRSVALLEKAGAQVTYCEDDVGHKLSASCFRGLETFFSRL